MKKAKRMTLFNIMINVSRNGIKAIMKNDPIKYFPNQDENVASEPTAKSDQAHAPLRSACTTGPKPTLRQNTVAVFLTRTIQEKIKLDQIKNTR